MLSRTGAALTNHQMCFGAAGPHKGTSSSDDVTDAWAQVVLGPHVSNNVTVQSTSGEPVRMVQYCHPVMFRSPSARIILIAVV